jgi:hypothetical protein
MSETLKKLKPFWRQDGADFIADLGYMKKAIVVRKFASDLSGKNAYYAIGQASYFPFKDEQYNTRFPYAYDACMLAENHIKDWFKSLLVNDGGMLENGLKLDEGTKKLLGDNCGICSRIIDEESRHCEISDCPHK